MFEQRGFEEAKPPRKTGLQVVCKPPKPVWVDLGAVFRIERPREHFSEGLDLQARIPGELSIWEKTTTGHWVGYVAFVMPKEGAGVRVAQWVLADALAPRDDAPARPEQRRRSS